jgi:hypothetical protein
VFVSTNESNTSMRELLRSEGWSPSGVLTGLDEGDPEHVFTVPGTDQFSAACGFTASTPVALLAGSAWPRRSVR